MADNMKTFLLILTSCILTGCGAYGEPLFLAWMYDSADTCQLRNNHGNYPSYCGAASGRTYVYSTPRAYAPLGNQVGYIQK